MKKWLHCLWHGHDWSEVATTIRPYTITNLWTGHSANGQDIIHRKHCKYCGKAVKWEEQP